ncbi:MAG: PEP-CTERM sorting domain-containing protein [Hapalosiphonaceae cyanobacterium JJU2]|nr:MAG: PEP-CTERM sorting domain-containing protein [Hapalosiphonaceae cyanobacterium JJU2]
MGISNPSDVLTAVFWDYNGSPLNLSLLSATASTVVSGSSTVGNNVDLLGSLNEWKLPNASNTNGLPGITQDYGIGTAGLGIFQGGGGQQFNYGIISNYSDDANKAVKDGTFVKGSATFLLSGLTSDFDITKIGNIRFQYGTSLSEASLTPTPTPAPAPAPAPTSKGTISFSATGSTYSDNLLSTYSA